MGTRGYGEGRLWPACGSGDPPDCGGCGRWGWQAVASRCLGDVAAGLRCHRSRIDPRKPADGSTVLRGAVTLHPQRRALVGGGEQLDGRRDGQAGLCPRKWALAPGPPCPGSRPWWGSAGPNPAAGGCGATCHPTASQGGWAWPVSCARGRAAGAELEPWLEPVALQEQLISLAAELLTGGQERSRPGWGKLGWACRGGHGRGGAGIESLPD